MAASSHFQTVSAERLRVGTDLLLCDLDACLSKTEGTRHACFSHGEGVPILIVIGHPDKSLIFFKIQMSLSCCKQASSCEESYTYVLVRS